nr:MAG TPA: Catabolite repression control protein [Caudoviricetes sp.]
MNTKICSVDNYFLLLIIPHQILIYKVSTF